MEEDYEYFKERFEELCKDYHDDFEVSKETMLNDLEEIIGRYF